MSPGDTADNVVTPPLTITGVFGEANTVATLWLPAMRTNSV
jgi:hypothetical protein